MLNSEKLRIRRQDAPQWQSLAPVFPEYVAGSSGQFPLARFVTKCEAATRTGVVFTPGLLRGPGFTRLSPWVSATVIGWAERALSGAERPTPQQRSQTESLVQSLSQARIGGCYWAPDLSHGPMKIVLRPARPAALDKLLADALAAHSATDLLVLDSGASSETIKKCHKLAVELAVSPVSPWSVLERAQALWVGGDDELAWLGIMVGKAVHCHASGLATGWGLTHDAIPERRASPRDATDFAAAILLQSARYLDPRTGHSIAPESAIALLSEWRDIATANRAIGCCVGFSFWKRRRIAAFFHNGERAPPFRRSARGAIKAAKQLPLATQIAAWNSRIPAGLEALAGQNLVRVEDGFIRSLGLGSGFLPPASIVVDQLGIYYDPRQVSDLEHILSESVFDDALCTRAKRLIARINQVGITKYQAGGAVAPLTCPTGRRCILVPGQVANDLSVALGGGFVRSNLALLETVRAANPQAWIVYKPHPDVEAGHRPGVVAVADLQRLADEVVRGGAMSALIGQVDEVHTMTSLAGFEALLRGRVVTVLGQPFYAGWGLTTDLAPLARRKRRLSLEELAAGVLILYPRYIDPASALPCGPEFLLARLEQPELWRAGWLMRLRALQGKMKVRLQSR